MLELSDNAQDIERAAEILRAGGLVAFPTETVYGLGARADAPVAVQKIFAAKGRPATHPVIVHLPNADWLAAWARDVPPEAMELARRFWPGPLTLILRRSDAVSDVVTGGQDTVGLRVPGHPVALALLTAAGLPVAAPSANRFGRVSATTAAHVVEDFGDTLDAIVDGGPCPVGVESTIVDLSGTSPRILRPGAISSEAVEAVLRRPIVQDKQGAPRVPGALASHYSPVAPLRLVESAEVLEVLAAETGSIVVLARTPPEVDRPSVLWIEMPEEAEAYARTLYDSLRRADAAHPDLIVVARPPSGRGWTAIHDRLRRAESDITQNGIVSE